jgi:hypothetical protein
MRIGCAVVDYGKPAETARCVASLRRDPAAGLIVVVENLSASADSLRQALAAVPGVDCVINDRNRGFAGGCNDGIARLRAGEPCDAVFLVNNDAWLPDDALSTLAAVLVDAAEVGIVAPRILMPDRRTVWAAGGVYNSLRGTGSDRGRGCPDGPAYSEAMDLPWTTGCAMLLRTRLFDEVGYFDESFFMYYEDLDLCLRARAHGWRIRYAPKAVVLHEGSLSAGGAYGDFTSYFRYRNRLKILAKHGTPTQIAANTFFLPLLALRDLAMYGLGGHWTAYRRLWLGVRDLLAGRSDVST